MTPVLPIFLLAFAHPSLASGEKPFEVVRSGDGQMSCEQLSTEIATLQSAEQRQAEREGRSRVTKGFLTGALSAAPSLIGGKLGGGMIAQYALSGALQGAQSNPAAPPARATSAEGQRVSHLSQIFGEKRC